MRRALPGKLYHRQPDRPRADDQHILSLLEPRAIDGMRADAERLHQG